jgi:hypothetical protein
MCFEDVDLQLGETMGIVPCQRSALTWPFLLLLPAIFVTLMGCDATVRTVTREAKPLAYVGQVQLGEPTKETGQIVVPLEYVGGDWMQNSAIVPIGVESTVKDAEIEITVVTSVATDDDVNRGYKLVLPEGSKGKYAIFYRDPDGARHKIGEVRIEE